MIVTNCCSDFWVLNLIILLQWDFWNSNIFLKQQKQVVIGKCRQQSRMYFSWQYNTPNSLAFVLTCFCRSHSLSKVFFPIVTSIWGSPKYLSLMCIYPCLISNLCYIRFPRLPSQVPQTRYLKTIEIYSPTVLGARSQKSRCQLGPAPNAGSGKESFLSSSFTWLEVFGVACLTE